ncbi:hypothetical protein ABZP36_009662 [Zizania latifolia]
MDVVVGKDKLRFDVSSAADRQRFNTTFIQGVRSELGNTSRPVMLDALRLPLQVDTPSFRELQLIAGGRTATLLLRTDNLYVVGFRNHAGQWFEFRPEEDGGQATIQGATVLPFTGSYVGTNSIGPLNTPSNVSMNVEAMEGAVRGLAETSTGKEEKLKVWLRTLIVSFIESIRFTSVAAAVGEALRGQRSELEQYHISQIRNWGDISTALLAAANDVVQDPDTNLFSQFIQHCRIHNAYEAAITLGLVLATAKANRRQTRAAADGDVALGLTLVEVLSVRILNIDGESPGDLYGTVRVVDSFGGVNVFSRARADAQSVYPGDNAELVWPSRVVSAADDFVIDVHLMDRDKDPSPDDEVAKGTVVWNSREALSSHRNVVTSQLITGKYGSAQVFYAVLTNAVAATVAVLLINGDGESVPDVYGSITAKTDMSGSGGNKSLQYELFKRGNNEDVGVPANTYIPLKRKVVAAALGSPFKVDADLWDRDRDLSPDDQIALGSVSFNPRFSGTDTAKINGMYGQIEVQVTWSPSVIQP